MFEMGKEMLSRKEKNILKRDLRGFPMPLDGWTQEDTAVRHFESEQKGTSCVLLSSVLHH